MVAEGSELLLLLRPKPRLPILIREITHFMDPLTHALASYSLQRAAFPRISRATIFAAAFPFAPVPVPVAQVASTRIITDARATF